MKIDYINTETFLKIVKVRKISDKYSYVRFYEKQKKESEAEEDLKNKVNCYI